MGKEYVTVDGQAGQDFKETSAPRNFGITTLKELMSQYENSRSSPRVCDSSTPQNQRRAREANQKGI